MSAAIIILTAADTGLETFFTLSEQAELFLMSAALGVILGAVFDLFRAARIIFPPLGKTVPTAVCDVLYLSVCGIALYLLGLLKGRGSVEDFTILGALLGAVLYITIAGNAIIGLLRRIFSRIYGILGRIFGTASAKSASVFSKVRKKITSKFVKCAEKNEKSTKN